MPQKTVPPGIDRILFDTDELDAAVRRVAEAIARDQQGRPVLLVAVLKGALFFAADLARALAATPGGPEDVRIDAITVSSYGSAVRSSGEVRLVHDTTVSLEGRDVVIVEDIVDNGHTLHYLRGMLANRAPASLRAAVLLDKPARRAVDVPVDYVGLTCPDAFVVGYGLDYAERWRALPYVATVDPDLIPG